VDAAVSEQAALRLAAADAMAGREITAREYMAVRIRSGYQRLMLLNLVREAQPGEGRQVVTGRSGAWWRRRVRRSRSWTS